MQTPPHDATNEEAQALIERRQISQAIVRMRDKYIATSAAQSHWEINNGLCDDFASDVVAELGLGGDKLYDICGENLMVDGVDSDGLWDWKLLQKYWDIAPPAGLTKKQVSNIEFGGHVWLTDGKIHFDAECPDGVQSFFDLPVFRRYIVEDLRKRGIPCEDVVTDDVVASPACPEPNPARPTSAKRMKI